MGGLLTGTQMLPQNAEIIKTRTLAMMMKITIARGTQTKENVSTLSARHVDLEITVFMMASACGGLNLTANADATRWITPPNANFGAGRPDAMSTLKRVA